MQKDTWMYRTLEAIAKHGPLWSYEVNKATGYFKSCSRASDLCKKGLARVCDKKKTSKNAPYMYRYEATEAGVLLVGCDVIQEA